MIASRLRALLLASLTAVALPAGAGDEAPVADAAPAHLRHESDRGPLLLGTVDADAILAAFPDWPEDLGDWQPDTTAVAGLRQVASSTDILCVLGTWCGDSQREVPRFWRLLETTANPNLRFTMVAVGRAADTAADQALAGLGLGADYRADHSIEKVPTFIFSQEGREIGRIIETPAISLEADALAILEGAGLLPVATPPPDQGAR